MSRLTKFNRMKPKEEVSISIDPELVGLSNPESSFGVNTNHPPRKHFGVKNARAAGAYGMMPITSMELYNKSPRLQEKYPDIADIMSDYKNNHSQISQLVEDDPELSADLAREHLDSLKIDQPSGKVNSLEVMILGHNKGKAGAKETLKSPLSTEDSKYINDFKIGFKKVEPKMSVSDPEAFKQLKQMLKLK